MVDASKYITIPLAAAMRLVADRVIYKPGDRVGNTKSKRTGTVIHTRPDDRFARGHFLVAVKWDIDPNHPQWNTPNNRNYEIYDSYLYLLQPELNFSKESAYKFKPGDRIIHNAGQHGTVRYVRDSRSLPGHTICCIKWDDPAWEKSKEKERASKEICPWGKDGKVGWYAEWLQPEQQNLFDPKTAAMGKEERELRKKFSPGTKVKTEAGGTGTVTGTLFYSRATNNLKVKVTWDNPSEDYPVQCPWWVNTYPRLSVIEAQGELFDPKTAAMGKEERELRKKFAPGTRVCWDTDHTQEGTITEILAKAQHSNTLILKVKWDIWDKIYTEYSESLIPLAQQRNLFNPIASQGTVKTAISLPDIVRQTNQFSKKYRPGCTPTLIDSNPKNLSLHYNVKCNKEDSDPAGHDVRVQFDVTKIENSQRANDLDVKCNCSCPAFLMWGAQWNLHQRDGLLPPTRPLLQAPKERLDLRGNYVICKHIHCVFERILPSVQHNIVKILREREIRSKKDRVEEIPQELQEKQKEMKEKRELEKIHDTKDKKIKDRLLQKLQDEEETRLLHEKELEEKGNEPPEDEIQRDQPATEPVSLEEEEETTPAWMRLPEHYEKVSPEDEEVEAIQDLTQQEEAKIEQLHEEHKPHLHKGLPYDVDEDPDEIKGKGWKGKRLSSTKQKFRIGDKVIAAMRSNRIYWKDVNGEVKSAFWSKRQSTYIYLIKYKNSDLTANPDNEMETTWIPEMDLTPIQQELNFGKTSSMYAFRIGDKVTFQGFLTHKWFVGEVIERKKEKGWRAGKRDWNNSYLITWIGEGPSGCSRSWLSERHLSSTQQELFKESSTKWKFRVGDYVVRKYPSVIPEQNNIPGEIKEIRQGKSFEKWEVKCRVVWTEPKPYEYWFDENLLELAQQELFKESSTKWKFRVGDYVVRKEPLTSATKFQKQCVIPGKIKEITFIKRGVICLVAWTEPELYEGWVAESNLNPAQQELFKEGSTKHRFRKGDKVTKYNAFGDGQGSNVFDQLSGEVEKLDIDARNIWYRVRWDETDKVSGVLKHYTAWEVDNNLMPAQQSLFKNAKFKIGDTAKFKFKVGDRVRHMLGSICIGTITKRYHKGRHEYEVLWDAIPNALHDGCHKPFSLPAKEENLRSVQLDLFDEESGTHQASKHHKYKVGDKVRWFTFTRNDPYIGTVVKLLPKPHDYVIEWEREHAPACFWGYGSASWTYEYPKWKSKSSEDMLRPEHPPQQMQMFDEEKTSARAFKFQVGDAVQDVDQGKRDRKGTVTFRQRGKDSNYYNITWDHYRQVAGGRWEKSKSYAMHEKWLRSTQEELPFEKSSARFKYAIGDRVINTYSGDLGTVRKKYTQRRREGSFDAGNKIYIIEWDGWVNRTNGKIITLEPTFKTKTSEHYLDPAQKNMFKEASGWKWRIGEPVWYRDTGNYPRDFSGVVVSRYKDKNTGDRHYVIRWDADNWGAEKPLWANCDIAEDADKLVIDKFTPQQSELFKEASRRKWVQGERIVYQPQNRGKIYRKAP